MDDSLIDWGRLERFIRREGTPAELAELERWVAADPRRRALAEAMRTVGAGRSPQRAEPPHHWDAGRALRRVQRQLAAARVARRLPRLGIADRSRGARRFELAISVLGAVAAVVI